MKISGFSFVRNAVRFDYPFLESISSILPLCDEFVVAVGKSDDDTLLRLQSLRSPKLKIIETVWDDSQRKGGTILSQQTNLALDNASGDWAFYLQADEVVHENDLPAIAAALRRYQSDRAVEGILFSYKHFYGGYNYLGHSRRWYRREVRVVKTGIGVRSWGDAQGFRIQKRKLHVKPIDASIYHYGWVRSPRTQQTKQRSFHRLWHPDTWVEEHVGDSTEFDYAQSGRLVPFADSHPAVMKARVASQDWQFAYDPSNVRIPMKEKILDWIEMKTNIRIGEYRNYRLLK